VPVKGVDIDKEALDLALAIAAPTERRGKQKVRVVVIHVVEVPRALPLDADLADAVSVGENALAQAERAARGADVQVETEILQARSIGAAIVDEATERGVDLIIMAAQNHRRLGEFSPGVTLPYVLKNSPCRVWVTRAPQQVEASVY